jgi:hypothetical protein
MQCLIAKETPSLVEASRHACQEARFVLTSLRGGPPPVARGELAQDLFDLRQRLGNGVLIEDAARPFLQVIMDPRAAGPHTLVALRAMQRLLSAKSLDTFQVPLERCMQGVLSCKFEQTDAAADEAVEMAIADVLCLIVMKDTEATIRDATLMDAFHTVFVTRNTFVHSPALCYHFEDVLQQMVYAIFSRRQKEACRLLMEFLVNQLLHTPLVGGDNMDESTREAQLAHDSTRILCLRLTRRIIKTEWLINDETLLAIVQDDLSLSLLMTGQAIWAYHDTHASPGFVSLEVLSEVSTELAGCNIVCQAQRLTFHFVTDLRNYCDTLEYVIPTKALGLTVRSNLHWFLHSCTGSPSKKETTNGLDQF